MFMNVLLIILCLLKQTLQTSLTQAVKITYYILTQVSQMDHNENDCSIYVLPECIMSIKSN